MRKSSGAGLPRKRRGQGFAEFALILPILLLIFGGMVEIGWWANSWISVATAAREGARFGSRGLHIPPATIADVTRIALENSVQVNLVGPDANTRIFITEVDVDPDGSFDVFASHSIGDLAAASGLCYTAPCSSTSIDLSRVRDANVAFNAEPAFCTDPFGCRDDLVIVEIHYRHQPLMPIGGITEYIGDVVNINARGIMRVMFRRNPF